MVVETALQVSHLARLRARATTSKPEETWDFRIQVAEARKGEVGQGIVLVRGEDGKGWALIGTGSEKGGTVRMECEVRVRKPVWEVELMGEKWTVGVEWEVFKQASA
jgi:hypothetical protein